MAAGLAGPDGAGAAPDRPAADGRAAGDVAVGLVPEPRPAGGMSRTLPVLGNSYGIVLATVG